MVAEELLLGHRDLGVLVGVVPRLVELPEHLGALGVGGLRAVQREVLHAALATHIQIAKSHAVP